MRKFFAYILSVPFYLAFGLCLVVFHVLQVITFRVFGYQAHKKSVDIFNFFLLRCLNLLGNRVSFRNHFNFNRQNAHIIIANHQSMFDIPPLIWHLRQLHPKFISKKELGKGIPGISYNLKYGGSILIDRDDRSQALEAIAGFGAYLSKFKRSAVIFPEGTRSRTGQPKSFSRNGLKTLFKHCPEAKIVPVSINNSWKLQGFGMFPMNIGLHLKFEVHQPLNLDDFKTHDELIDQVEATITSHVYPVKTQTS
jgi:1-acyl-sn-glycerol-3-phosphate acyltransferase